MLRIVQVQQGIVGWFDGFDIRMDFLWVQELTNYLRIYNNNITF